MVGGSAGNGVQQQTMPRFWGSTTAVDRGRHPGLRSRGTWKLALCLCWLPELVLPCSQYLVRTCVSPHHCLRSPVSSSRKSVWVIPLSWKCEGYSKKGPPTWPLEQLRWIPAQAQVWQACSLLGSEGESAQMLLYSGKPWVLSRPTSASIPGSCAALSDGDSLRPSTWACQLLNFATVLYL